MIYLLIGCLPIKVASFGGLDVFIPENKPTEENDLELLNMWGAWENIDSFDSEKVFIIKNFV